MGLFSRLLQSSIRYIEKDLDRKSPHAMEEVYAKKVALYTRRYGTVDQRTLAIRMYYAAAMINSGNASGAEAEAAELIPELHSLDSSGSALWLRAARKCHARALSELGRNDEAAAEWDILASDNDRVLGPANEESIEAHECHAVALWRLGRGSEAEPELAAAVAMRTATSGADTDATLKARKNHAEVLSDLGRYQESEAAWKELADAYNRLKGASDPATLDARDMHAQALYELGRMLDAAVEFAQVAEVRESVLGASHPDTRRVRRWQEAAERKSHDR